MTLMAPLESLAAIILLALLKAMLDRVSKRAAAWVLPDYQPLTFRLAWLILRAATRLAPRQVFHYTA